MLIILGATALGVLLGFLGAHATVLGLWTLLPWAVGAAGVGCLARRRPGAAGAAYGFALAFVFMLGVYTGKASALSRVPFFALLGVIGALCGAGLALAAHWIARRAALRRGSSDLPPDAR